MIYSGIEIGMYFELNFDGTSECKNLFSVVRPVLQMIFVFSQMYFVFLNQKVCFQKLSFVKCNENFQQFKAKLEHVEHLS